MSRLRRLAAGLLCAFAASAAAARPGEEPLFPETDAAYVIGPEAQDLGPQDEASRACQVRHEAARAAAAAGDYAGALRELDAAEKTAAAAFGPLDRLTLQAQVDSTHLAWSVGLTEKAEATLRALRRSARNDLVARLHYAKALRRIGRLAAAEAELNKAARLAPRSHLVWVQRSRIQRERGDDAAALSSLERAAALRPDDVGLAIELAEALQDAGEHAAAEETLRRASAASAAGAVVLRDLGYTEPPRAREVRAGAGGAAFRPGGSVAQGLPGERRAGPRGGPLDPARPPLREDGAFPGSGRRLFPGPADPARIFPGPRIPRAPAQLGEDEVPGARPMTAFDNRPKTR
jgi:tetratricopeptide (TPR) repeat protein